MKIDKQRKLFFGAKIDSKLREALANATPGDRHYFEDPDSPYLRICNVGEERWIGKAIDSGLGASDVEDMQRNIVSILRRIAPNVRHNPNNIKIHTVADELVEVAEPESSSSSRGPYIGS